MCYLIHFGVRDEYACDLETRRQPHVARHANASVEAAFGPGFSLFLVADGGCSCSLYSSPRSKGRERSETLREKYARLGWSEAKIARALEASAAAREQNRRATEAGLREDIASFLADLANDAGEVRVIVHHYHGSFAEERVTAAGSETIAAGDLRTGGRHEILEDRVYRIQPSAVRR